MGQRNLSRRQKGAAKGITDGQRRQICEQVLELLREELAISAERQGLGRLSSAKTS